MYSLKNNTVKVIKWGNINYGEALEAQTKIFNQIVEQKIHNRDRTEPSKSPTPNFLVICQHPPVYTIGKSGNEANMLISEHSRIDNKIEYFHTNRGGDITFHGPGQMVVYPILDLDNFFTDIHQYMRYLEECIILTLDEFNIKAGRIKSLTGVWIDYDVKAIKPRKIAALGVKLSRWVSMHGLALNVNTDLKYFNNIVPCGIVDKAVTSMQQELNKEINIEIVQEVFLKHFSKLFDVQLEF